MDITSNLELWYKFDEGSGSSAVDSSGNSRTGTLTNSPTYIAGKIGTNALTFNGSTQYVTAPITINFSALTVACWFKMPSFAGVANPRMMANSHSDTDFVGFQLAVNSGGTTGFFDIGANTFSIEVPWTQTLSVDTWYHYVGTYGDGGGYGKAYINGVQVGIAGPFGLGAIISSGINMSVGRNPAYNGDYVAGSIDDVRVYSRALSAIDVAALYAYTGSTVNKGIGFFNLMK